MTDFEPIVGRYLTVTIQGRANRVYVEASGEGVPVLCLHTAGADARRYRTFQTDSKILERFQVFAFDLPWHGKSLPPDGYYP